jgi:hypothetical protein
MVLHTGNAAQGFVHHVYSVPMNSIDVCIGCAQGVMLGTWFVPHGMDSLMQPGTLHE